MGGRRRERGMTVVEFAVVIPIALLVVFGIVQIGLMIRPSRLSMKGPLSPPAPARSRTRSWM